VGHGTTRGEMGDPRAGSNNDPGRSAFREQLRTPGTFEFAVASARTLPNDRSPELPRIELLGDVGVAAGQGAAGAVKPRHPPGAALLSLPDRAGGEPEVEAPEAQVLPHAGRLPHARALPVCVDQLGPDSCCPTVRAKPESHTGDPSGRSLARRSSAGVIPGGEARRCRPWLASTGRCLHSCSRARGEGEERRRTSRAPPK
jgi:hypothetical protein